jgi:hypothetical protein
MQAINKNKGIEDGRCLPGTVWRDEQLFFAIASANASLVKPSEQALHF